MTQEQFFARYKYDVEDDLLGGGGFGKVYKAFDDTLNRYVAIKVSELKKGQESLSLMKEVELAASLTKHKNIAHYEECFRFRLHNGTFDYGILQYYPLGNLSQLVRSKKLKDSDKESIAEGIIAGINHLHGHNVVHRDLKSANILMAEGYHGEYVPKIADFGLSKQFTENEKSYFSNSFAGGSLLFVAPEQLEGKELRKNVDLWSLGVVLYELFVGETPFKASMDDGSETARAEIISKIKNASIPSAISTVLSRWQEVIRGCLVTDPTRRTKSIEEVMSKVGIPGGITSDTVLETDGNKLTKDEDNVMEGSLEINETRIIGLSVIPIIIKIIRNVLTNFNIEHDIIPFIIIPMIVCSGFYYLWNNDPSKYSFTHALTFMLIIVYFLIIFCAIFGIEVTPYNEIRSLLNNF